MIDSKKNKKERLSVEELTLLAAKATSEAAKKNREKSDIIVTVKKGYLIEEKKDGSKRVIRKVSSRQVTPGTRYTFNKK